MERKHPKLRRVAGANGYRNWGPSGDPAHGETDFQPEKKLLLAVLADAVKCMRETRPSSKQQKLAEAAREWVLSNNNRAYPFCFQDVCRALDWDPQRARNSLGKNVNRQRRPV